MRKPTPKETKKYSVWSNFGYSLKNVFSVNAWDPIAAFLSMLVSLAATVYATYENKLLLDALDSGDMLTRIVLSIAGIVGIYLVIKLLNRILWVVANVQSEASWGKLFKKGLKTLYSADYDKLEAPEYKNIYSQYMDYAPGATRNEIYAVFTLITSILSVLIFGTMVSMLHPLIAVGLAVMAVVHYYIKKPLVKIQQKMNLRLVANDRKFSYTTGISNDFENAKEMRLYGMSGWIHEITDDCMKEHRAVHSLIQWRTFGVGACHNFLNFLRDAFAYIYLILLFSKGDMTPGDFMLYFTAITSLSQTLTNFAEKFSEIHKYDLQVTELRKAETIMTSRNRGKGLPIPTSGITIEFRGVTFRYPNAEYDTIKNISFRMKAGEKLALVGVNGAGKTTLVKLLCGLYLPTEGEILLNGHPVSDYNIRDYYSLFSAVFQDISLMPLSIAENVACTAVAEEIDRERVMKALEDAGLGAKIRSLEKGIDTLYDKEANQDAVDFSGGEKQKLALARAIYLERPFLVLDEPTSALDPIAENEMYLRFREITKEQTALFISHRLASTRFCDRIFHLENGVIIEEGTHDELIKKNGKYAEMFRLQSRYYEEKKAGENDA